MAKYNVSLKTRFEVEDQNLAEAVKNVIYVLTNNFENVRHLELTNIWEVREPGSDQIEARADAPQSERSIGL